MPKKSRLEDPDYAQFAWARYWRLMRWMAAVTILAIIISLSFLYYKHGMISIHLYIATAIGIFCAMMLTAGLMGLVFLSNGSRHDEAIEELPESEWNDENSEG